MKLEIDRSSGHHVMGRALSFAGFVIEYLRSLLDEEQLWHMPEEVNYEWYQLGDGTYVLIVSTDEWADQSKGQEQEIWCHIGFVSGQYTLQKLAFYTGDTELLVKIMYGMHRTHPLTNYGDREAQSTLERFGDDEDSIPPPLRAIHDLVRPCGV